MTAALYIAAGLLGIALVLALGMGFWLKHVQAGLDREYEDERP